MTWYEILESPLPAASSQEPAMAAHIVRWWRTKFRNGYKQFSVLAEGERTDTEELVGRAPSQCSAPPDLLPSGAARALLSPEPASAHTEPAQTQREPSPVTPPTPANADRLHFEEFTCDVQVRGGEAGGGAQPLHFSFTLYDFDGHGRITKDDIAGIVSTIYESVGKTVTVPHYGSKTIQVRLTVSPDRRRAAEESPGGPDGLPSSSPARADQKVRFKRDLSAHVREGRRKPRRRRPERQISPAPPRAIDVDERAEAIPSAPADEERRSRLSIDDDVSDCSERLRTPKGFKRNVRQRQYQKNNLSPRYRNHQNNLNCNNTHKNDIWNSQRDNVLSEVQLCSWSPERTGVQSADGGRVRGGTDKKRSGSLQRRELLEIIQANMEKNHLSFQTTRKQYIDQRGVNSLEGDSLNVKHRQRNRSNTFTGKHSSEPISRTVFSDQPNNGYLDLANTNINSHKESNLCRYDSFLHAVICSSSQHAKSGYHLKSQQSSTQQKPWKSHHRSRSHDLDQGPFRYTLLEPYECITPEVPSEALKPLTDTRAKSFDYCREQEVLHRVNVTSEGKVKSNRTDEKKSKSYDLEHNIEALRKTNVNRKTAVQSHAFSPHHIKHQNREKYHARAMAQVEKWLENDNNTRLTKNPKKKWTDQNCKVSEKVDNLTANLDLNDSVEWKGLLRGSEVDAEGAESGGTSTVHRYVHEHIHHHYHHFEDKIPATNAVVV